VGRSDGRLCPRCEGVVLADTVTGISFKGEETVLIIVTYVIAR
jgi:hypothetical protein